MAAVQEFFGQWWVGAGLALLGVVLGIVSIFSYRFGIKSPKPVYQKTALRLIGGEHALPSEVEVLYSSKPVQRLTKLVVIFWNDGTSVLDKADVAESDPLKLKVDGEVLSAQLLKQTKPVNQFRVRLDDTYINIAHISFDYLDPKDGAVIEILHTAHEKYASFEGSIKGLAMGVRDLGVVSPRPYRRITFDFFSTSKRRQRTSPPVFVLWITGILGVVLLCSVLFPNLSYLTWLDGDSQDAPGSRWFKALQVVTALMYISIPILFYLRAKRRYPKGLALEEFV